MYFTCSFKVYGLPLVRILLYIAGVSFNFQHTHKLHNTPFTDTRIVSLYRTEFGLGYAWQPAVTVIAAGDIVRFQWTSPLFLNTNLFRVLQTFSAEADYDGTGFNSGTPSPTG